MKKKKVGKNKKVYEGKRAPEPEAKRILLAAVDDHPWIVPLLLFFLSFLFRFHFRNDGLFHHDEVLLAKAVEGSLEHGGLLGAVNGRYGAVLLNLLFYAPYHWITGDGSERILVLTAVLSGGILAVVIYHFVRDWCEDRAAGIFSSLFLTFNFLFLTTSTLGKEHTHQLLFIGLGFWLFHRGARARSLLFKTLGMTAFAFSLTVHESTMPLIPVFLAFLVLANRSVNGDRKTQLRDMAIFCVLLAVPFGLYLGGVLFRTLTVKDTGTVSFLGLFSPVLRMAAGDLFAATGFPLAALSLVGIAANAKKPDIVIPAALWALLLFYYGNTSGYTTRHLILIVLLFSMLGGMGAGFLVGKVKRLSLLQAASGLVLILVVCGYGIYKSYPLIRFRKDYCGPKKMAEFVEAKTEPDAFIITMDESVYIDYYAHRKVMTHPVAEYAANREFVEQVRAMALSGKTFYVNSTAFSYDYQKHFEKLMLENFRFLPVGEVLDEEYHRPELGFTLFKNQLFRIVPR